MFQQVFVRSLPFNPISTRLELLSIFRAGSNPRKRLILHNCHRTIRDGSKIECFLKSTCEDASFSSTTVLRDLPAWKLIDKFLSFYSTYGFWRKSKENSALPCFRTQYSASIPSDSVLSNYHYWLHFIFSTLDYQWGKNIWEFSWVRILAA